MVKIEPCILNHVKSVYYLRNVNRGGALSKNRINNIHVDCIRIVDTISSNTFQNIFTKHGFHRAFLRIVQIFLNNYI